MIHFYLVWQIKLVFGPPVFAFLSVFPPPHHSQVHAQGVPLPGGPSRRLEDKGLP